MKIQINAGDVQSSDAIREKITSEVEGAMKHFADRVTRVEVHLRDDNAGKAGSNDKRCTMEARIANHQPVAVDDSSDDLYQSIAESARKLGVVVQKHFDRLTEH